MADWKSKVLSIIGKADEMSDGVRSRIRRLTGHDGPLIIHSYFGHGTVRKVSYRQKMRTPTGRISSTCTNVSRAMKYLALVYVSVLEM